MLDFADLIGMTCTNVHLIDDDWIEFDTTEGKSYALMHHQDCCENVFVESIVGDLADLIGTPILLAEEATSENLPEGARAPSEETGGGSESQTWTFYKLRTIKGSVDIRWYGGSNGYYSETVSFSEVERGEYQGQQLRDRRTQILKDSRSKG